MCRLTGGRYLCAVRAFYCYSEIVCHCYMVNLRARRKTMMFAWANREWICFTFMAFWMGTNIHRTRWSIWWTKRIMKREPNDEWCAQLAMGKFVKRVRGQNMTDLTLLFDRWWIFNFFFFVAIASSMVQFIGGRAVCCIMHRMGGVWSIYSCKTVDKRIYIFVIHQMNNENVAETCPINPMSAVFAQPSAILLLCNNTCATSEIVCKASVLC